MTQQEFQKRYTYNPATDKLGEGGFGKVLKAYDNYLDKWVAMKIAPVGAHDSIRLKKEVEMVSKLPAHPNIAKYEECYTFPSYDGELDFGILQYYEEGNLSQLLKNNTLTLDQKRSVLMQILEGIHFLHNNGIIHRDLKPQNILIVKRGAEYIPKITDFGISKQLDINKSSVFSNSIAGAGTLAYSSPEQLFDREIRKNTDLWSFGVIAFQTLTGQLPFNTGGHDSTSEAGRAELFRQINSGQLPYITTQIPEPWQTVIRRCLVTDAVTRVKNTKEAEDILLGNDENGGNGGRDAMNCVSTETDDKTRIENNAPHKTPPSPITIIADNTIIEQKSDIDEPEMVYVQGGTFTMGFTTEQGADCDNDEKPAHQVTLSSFYIGKYEVTQAQWEAIMGNNQSSFKGVNLPVENVSWNDVQEFIRKLNAQTGKQYRLPTEAEWEYAARGGASSRGYKYSGSNTSGNVAWYSENSGNRTRPVGTKFPNELGIYDMSGNVWEWCSDWYGEYCSSVQTNPKGPSSGSDRMARGGSWISYARRVRVSNRDYYAPDFRRSILGFRLASSSK